MIIIMPEFLAIVFPRLWSTASVGDVNLVFKGYDSNITSMCKRRVTTDDDMINHWAKSDISYSTYLRIMMPKAQQDNYSMIRY